MSKTVVDLKLSHRDLLFMSDNLSESGPGDVYKDVTPNDVDGIWLLRVHRETPYYGDDEGGFEVPVPGLPGVQQGIFSKRPGVHPAVRLVVSKGAQEAINQMGPGEIRAFSSGATRDTEQGKLDYEGFLSPLVLKAFAEYMDANRKQKDGTYRDSDNWQKGIPRKAYVKSLWRHFFDVWTWWRGQSEPNRAWIPAGGIVTALCACLFNVQGLLHEILLDRNVEEKS